MPILASRLQAMMASSLDATEASSGENRYTFNEDYSFAINYAARKLLEWASQKQGSTKFNSELLRELRNIWVFQTSNYSRVEIPATVNTINAVYPEILFSPTNAALLGNINTYSWPIEFSENNLASTASLIVTYNGSQQELDAGDPQEAADIVSIINAFFNTELELGDVFTASDPDGPITGVSNSVTIYGPMIFKAANGSILATITPTVSAGTLYDWFSMKRTDIIFLNVVKDAQRSNDEERASQRSNVFSPGYEKSDRTIKKYAYWDITDFNSGAYIPNPGREMKEIQIAPARNKQFIGIALVENHTDVEENTEMVDIPEEFFNLMVEVGLLYIRFKQQQELLSTKLNDLLKLSIVNYGL